MYVSQLIFQKCALEKLSRFIAYQHICSVKRSSVVERSSLHLVFVYVPHHMLITTLDTNVCDLRVNLNVRVRSLTVVTVVQP